jgi:outer membrane protein TolC
VVAELRSQVSAAYADVTATRQQVELTARQLVSAEAGFREDLERIRNTVGRPIEVVDSLQLLNQARVARIRAVTDYNKAQFRLFVHLGSPPPLASPPTDPLPPAPLALPPLPPLDGLVAHTDGPIEHTPPFPIGEPHVTGFRE